MPSYKEALKKLKGKKKPATTKSQKKQKRKKTSAVLRRSRRKATKFRASAVTRKALKKKRPARKAKAKKKIKPKKKVVRKIKKKVKPKRKVRPKKKVVRKKIKKKKVIKRAKPKKKVIRRKRIVKRKTVKRKKPVKKRVVKKKRIAKKRKPRKKKVIKPRVYVGKGTLDQLFESQAKVKLLKFFFRNTEGMFQPKEIFKRLRSNIALLRQEMKKLEKLGLIRQRKAWLSFEKKRGGVRRERKTVCYLNSNFDFFNELRDLVLKSSIASKDDLVEEAKRTGNIKLLVLTGVFTGDEGAKADLLIVGDKINQRKLNNFIKDLEAEVGKEINCAVMTTKEFNYRYDMYDRFVRDLLDGKNEILLKRLDLW